MIIRAGQSQQTFFCILGHIRQGDEQTTVSSSDEKAEEESHQDHGQKGDGVGVVLDHDERVDDGVEEQLPHLHVERHERLDGAALVAVVVVVVLLTNRTREVEADAELVGITEGLGWRSNSTSI